jgi:hypothetical protein
MASAWPKVRKSYHRAGAYRRFNPRIYFDRLFMDPPNSFFVVRRTQRLI